MDVEKIVKEYHSQMIVSDMKEPLDLVSPWFNRMRCFEEGYLLPRCTVAIVAIVGVISCGLELMMKDTTFFQNSDVVQSAKTILFTLFTVASVLLFFSTIVENELFVQLYLWYTPGFVILGLVLAIAEFVFKCAGESEYRHTKAFMVEVAFLFTIFRCLPLVNKYLREMTKSQILSFQ